MSLKRQNSANMDPPAAEDKAIEEQQNGAAQAHDPASADTEEQRTQMAEQVGALSSTLLECAVCLQLLCEPLTTPCGHSFCRPCLVSTLRKNKKKCPTCRAVCHMEPETQSESIVLSTIIKSCFPAQYETRLKEVEREKASWYTILPIFYYNETLFPFSLLSLHLFEERYKLMIRRIVESSRKFSYLPNFSNYQASVGDVGVIAEITDVEFMANGRANLQAKCKDRFRILEHWVEDGTQGLHWCKVEILRDAPAQDVASLTTLTRDCKQLFEAFVQHCGDTARAEIDSVYGKQPDDPEVLLESQQTEDRLQACHALMKAMLTRR